MLSDEELLVLLDDIESDRVERKQSINDRRVIRQAICAFANDLPNHRQPGIIFIGVDDNGNCVNLTITDELLRGAHQAAVHDCYNDFKNLARQIADRCDVPLPIVY